MTEYTRLIVESIQKSLTGIYEEDMHILQTATEKYKKDEEAPEIITAIADMMYEILPEDEKEELAARVEGHRSDFKADFEKAEGLIRAGDYKAAKAVVEDVLKAAEANRPETGIFMSFNHTMELYIYIFYLKPEAEVKISDIPYNKFYGTYGFILMQLELHDEAEKAFKKGLEWNPVDLDLMLSLAENQKISGRMEEFLETTKALHRLSCTRATMARYYRNIAYYYMEQYKPEIARALYVYSNIYFHTENADNELLFIEKALNEITPEYSIEEIQELLIANGIEPGPETATIGIIYRLGKMMLEEGNKETAQDCFSIVYDITQDAEVKELLQQLD